MGTSVLGSALDGYPNVLQMTDVGAGTNAAGMMDPGMLGAGVEDPSRVAFTEYDTLAMWSNAPQGFEWDDWGTFITHGLGPQPGTSA